MEKLKLVKIKEDVETLFRILVGITEFKP